MRLCILTELLLIILDPIAHLCLVFIEGLIKLLSAIVSILEAIVFQAGHAQLKTCLLGLVNLDFVTQESLHRQVLLLYSVQVAIFHVFFLTDRGDVLDDLTQSVEPLCHVFNEVLVRQATMFDLGERFAVLFRTILYILEHIVAVFTEHIT